MLVVGLITTTELDRPLRLAAGITLAVVIGFAMARQTMLLRDRERVIGRERQLTDELTVAEAQYRSVVERVPGVVYVAEAGQHGRWHFVSSKIEELLGYTAGGMGRGSDALDEPHSPGRPRPNDPRRGR